MKRPKRQKHYKDQWYRGASINRAGLVIYDSPLQERAVFKSSREDENT